MCLSVVVGLPLFKRMSRISWGTWSLPQIFWETEIKCLHLSWNKAATRDQRPLHISEKSNQTCALCSSSQRWEQMANTDLHKDQDPVYWMDRSSGVPASLGIQKESQRSLYNQNIFNSLQKNWRGVKEKRSDVLSEAWPVSDRLCKQHMLLNKT